jgi:hypothetical protein
MANLIPYKKNNTSSLIKIDKLISSSLIKKSAKIDSKIGSKIDPEEKTLLNIQQKVIKIDKLLKNSLLLKKKDTEKKRVSTEQTEFEQKEKDLEKNKPKAIPGIKLPSPPKLGIFDWIKNFIFNTLLGFVFVRLYEHLPKLLKLVPIIFKAGEFLINIGGKLLDGLVTFIDWGYKAYDATRGFVKNTFGEGGVKQFDNLMSTLNKLSSVIILASLAAAMPGGPGGGRSGGRGGVGIVGAKDIAGRSRYGASASAARRYAQRFGRDAAIKKFGEEGVRSLGGKYGRSGLTRFGRNALVGTLGKGGAKAVLKFVKPLVSKIPIIGGLIEFGLSWALGEPIGKAAFRGIGSVLVGAIGTAIGGPIGAFLGAWAGGEAGGALYDLFFGNKKPPQSKVAKAAGGGKPATRGGKLVGGPAKRTLKKKKTPRTLRATPSKLKPGAAVGGEKKIKELYPEPKDKNQMSPFGFLKNTYDRFSKSTGLDAPAALAIKSLMGDKPSAVDYKNSAMGINNWMNQTIASGTLAYAGGGEVKMESIVSGEDYSDVIAKSLQDSIAPQIDKTIQDLMEQMMLKPSTQPAGVPGSTTPTNQDTINIQGGDADFWTLVAVASREDGEPQAWADVAQSIYNRLASGAYSGKTIKDLILGQMQYEPTWKFPKPGAIGKPNQEWYAIKDAASAGAAAGQSEEAMKKVAAAILDPTLQKNAREFIQGRTDFRGYSVSGGVQRKSGDNYYGWYNNYKANKIGSVPNFGATATSGGGPGPGGSFVGGGTGAGYGGGGVKIAGDLGDFMKANRGKIGITGDIHQHPKHPGLSKRNYFSYHNQGRALDIGGYGPSHPSSGGRDEQAPVIRALLEWNKRNGYKPIEIIHGSPAFRGLGKYESAPNALHSHHVHVAYAKGGKTKGVPHFAMLGEKGREFVIDADSTAALERTFPGFLDAINKAKYNDAIRVLKSYTDYENPEPQIVEVPVYIEVEKPVPVPMGGGLMSGGGGIDNNDMFSDFDAIG